MRLAVRVTPRWTVREKAEERGREGEGEGDREKVREGERVCGGEGGRELEVQRVREREMERERDGERVGRRGDSTLSDDNVRVVCSSADNLEILMVRAPHLWLAQSRSCSPRKTQQNMKPCYNLYGCKLCTAKAAVLMRL